MNPAARAEARIKQLCCLGLASERVMPTLLAQMHAMIPCYANNFFWIDGGGEVSNAYHENFEEARATVPLFLSEFCNRREAEVLISFGEAIRYDRGVKTIEDSLKVDKRAYHRHDYYNLIMRPSNYLDSMRIVLRECDRAVGAVVVHRDIQQGRFSMQDKRHLASIAPFIAHAVNASGDTHAQGALVDDGVSELVIVNRRGKVQHMSPDANRLLFLATHPQVSATTFARAYGTTKLPGELLRLCRNLVNVFEGKQAAAGPPVWRHSNPWGGFSFRAHWLNNNGLNPGRINGGGANHVEPEPAPLIGITIQHEVPLRVKLITALARFALSRRQMDICLLLATDHPQTEIARRMGMSAHTVTTHVRRIYEKLGAHSKTELMNTLFST